MSIGPEVGFDPRDALGDGGGVGHVEGGGRSAGDRRGRGGEPRLVAAVQHHRRAVQRQPRAERVADALARAGDERPAPGQVEETAHGVAAAISSASRVQTSGGWAPETA